MMDAILLLLQLGFIASSVVAAVIVMRIFRLLRPRHEV